MKNNILRQRILFGILMLLLSALVYLLHYAFFRDARHIFIYLLGDIAFVFIQVLLVTLIIEQVLSEREKRAMLKKMNMVIGAFFSEAGNDLLKLFITFDLNADGLREKLVISEKWSQEEFDKVEESLARHEYKIESAKGDLAALKEFLADKRDFLLRLLENQNLLEHESFTELLWAISHLAEELSHRPNIASLPAADYNHLSGDIARAYMLLVREWLGHIEHLKKDYPYLFSLAARMNPFNPSASAIIS